MSDIDEYVAGARDAQARVAADDLDARLARAAAACRALEERAGTIVATAVAETGAAESFAARELRSALLFGDALPGMADALRPHDVPSRGGRTVVSWEPYGVVAGWHAANSPIWVPTLVALSALVAGNAMIGRPSRRASATTGAVLDAIATAWPDGAVTAAHVDPAGGEALITHPGVGAVVAHASTETCRRHLRLLADAYAAGVPLRPYIPEASGNDAAVVLPGADLPAAARAIALGGFTHAGQLCMAAKRVIVDARLWDAFVPLVVEAVTRMVEGEGRPRRIQTGTPAGRQAVAAIDDARAAGGTFLVGGPPAGADVVPALIALDAAHAPATVLWRDEVFAPVRSVVACDGVDDAVRLANASRYGLGAALFGGTDAERESFTRGVRAARVVVDEGPLYQDPHLVVGGVGDSGLAGARPKLEQLVWAKRVHWAQGGPTTPRS